MTEQIETREAEPVSTVNDDALSRRRKFWIRAIWISIVGVFSPLIVGLMGTVFGMVRAFNELSKPGKTEEAVADHISVSLQSTTWGLVVSVAFLIVLTVVSIRFFTLPKRSDPSPVRDSA